MLPFRTERLIVALCPDEVAVRIVGGKDTASEGETRVRAIDASIGASRWQDALVALTDLLPLVVRKSLFPTRKHASVILSDRFARYALLPWSPTIRSDVESEALAQACFESQYGDMTGWEIRIDHGDYGAARLACAVESGLLAALQALMAGRRIDCPTVEPYFAACWNRWRNDVGSSDALFSVQISGTAVIASRRADRWHSVRLQGGLGDVEALSAALRREALLQGFTELPSSYVHAPEMTEWTDDSIHFLSLGDAGYAVSSNVVATMIRVREPV